MKNKYAVAVMDNFENDNSVQIVEAENEFEAVRNAVLQFEGADQPDEDEEFNDYIKGLPSDNLEEMLSTLFDGELSVSKPVLIS